MNLIIGRDKEKKELSEMINSNTNELVCVYGRRRIGKTYLIKEFFNNNFDFYYTGVMNIINKKQLSLFQNEINIYQNRYDKTPTDWFTAFNNLKNYLLSLNKPQVLIFIDELPWMDVKNSNFVQAITNFWNTWDNHNEKRVILKCICCGSYASWMLNKMIADKGGLYGRTTRRIYLQPFSLIETEEYMNKMLNINYSREEILDLYMILGGIPYYLSMIKKELPISSNIDELFFNEKGKLREEYNFLFISLFNNSLYYESIVNLLSTKSSGLTRDDISKSLGLTGGMLTKILDNLVHCDFIREYQYFGNTKKLKIYQLSDFYCLFYLRFVKDNNPTSNYWTNILNTGKYNAWCGYAFEQICYSHIDQILNALSIKGVTTSTSTWRCESFTSKDNIEYPGGQIDLLIDRDDKIINICEIKYSKNEYIITKEYKEKIKERMEIFKTFTGTKKTLKCTFITSNGLKQSENNNIVNYSISANKLFNY